MTKLKDSGIPWIGEIPEQWVNCRFKDFLNLKSDIYSKNKIGLENIEPDSGKFIETESQFDGLGTHFIRHDVIYGKLRPYLRKVWVAEFEGSAVGDFYVFSCKKNVTSNYVKYLLLSEGFTQVVLGSVYGSKMPRVASEFILNLPFFVPPLGEQERIAAYLEEKCGEVDELIDVEQQMISDLESYRQAVITEAVTHGLNPDVPKKHTGIPWIGSIPEHWEIRKTSSIFSRIGSGTTPTSGNTLYYSDEGYNWLQTGDLNNGIIEWTSKKITKAALQDFSALKLYPIGSIVIAMYGATIGKIGKLNIETATNQACCVLTASSEINNDFAFYEFMMGRDELINLSYGAGQPNISQDIIKTFRIVVPPLTEQQEIAEYLDAKCAEIDELIKVKQEKIETLKQYRQCLIFEAVTGKITIA